MPLETGILTTKLYRPRTSGDLVPRPRLLQHLEERRDRPLTLVSAPAGYGKTTLVSTWIERRGGVTPPLPSAWVSLDEGDDGLVRFLTYMLAAVQTMFPRAVDGTRTVLNAANPPPATVWVPSLINELDQIERPFILVLDDYHHIHNMAVHDLVNGLLAHPPRPMHLVLTTRKDPPLDLPRLRVRRQVTEIRTQDLRFTEKETAAFVQQEMGIPADDRTVNTLLQRMEGWVAGMRLVTLSLRHQGSVDLNPARLGGSVSYVWDFLVAEVLEGQPQAVQDYLLSTAILDRFCAPLCESVCYGEAETPGSHAGPDSCELSGQAFVEWLQENNTFVIRLDERGEWYRYHHLFRDLLQSRLEEKVGVEGVAALHRRASAWFAQNRLIGEAIGHALVAGEVGAAAQLVAQHRHQAMNKERWHSLRRWLRMLPRDTVESDPQLLLIEAWLLIGWAEMADVAERVGALLAKLPPEAEDTRNLQAEFDALQSLIAYHVTDGQQALALAQQALENLPRDSASERGLAVMLKSMAHQMLGDLESARSVAWRALSERATYHQTYHARVLIGFCFLDSIAADMGSLRQSGAELMKLGQELGLAETAAHGYYFLGLSQYERNELAVAEESLLPVVKGAHIANLHNFAFCSFLLALTYQAQDRAAEAREVVEAVADRAMVIGNVSLLQTAQAFQAELAIRQGNPTAAQGWAKTFSPEPFYVAYRFYVPQITLPRYLMALDTPEGRRQAADLLSRLHDFFASIHNSRLLIEVLALQGLLLAADKDEAAALSTLERAVRLAEPGGFIRLFVDLGSRMTGILERLMERGVAPDYIAQILAVLATKGDADANIADARIRGRTTEATGGSGVLRPLPEPAEPLTNRQLEVLTLLAQRLTNKEIGVQLFISPGTVAQHTHQIYQKLDVQNRRQAVIRARTLSILPPS